jgi:cell division protein FtsB
MLRRFLTRPDDSGPAADDTPASGPEPQRAPVGGATGGATSLADLTIAGLTRRRMAFLLGALVAAWVIILFARQVSEASAATARADDLRAANEALVTEVEALERELELIKRQEYVVQQARAYRLGSTREIPFALEADPPALAPDAPGMAAVRLGAEEERRTPLESWLSLLFGPAG